MSSLELAVVGNCTIAAIIDRRASIVWSCFPDLAADPVFCKLLDGGHEAEAPDRGGHFSVELAGEYRCDQAYIENTAVLVSTLTDGKGNAVEITDFAPRFQQLGRMFRPPMLVRRIRPLGGQPRIRVRFRPRFNWGGEVPQISRGANHARYFSSSQCVRLTTDIPMSYVLEERLFLLDKTVSLFYGSDSPLTGEVENTSRDFVERTVDNWRVWVRGLSIPFEWQDAVIRAAITLKLCSFEETGAIVAALTTSIPEAPGTQRNWDYRYCWLRDAYFVIQALNKLGVTRTMEDYIGFISNVAADAAEAGADDLQPLYGITRLAILEEREAPDLPGYRGIGPVRVGNQAYLQRQNDVYGSVVVALTHSFFDKRMIRIGNMQLFRDLERLGERAKALFDQPDAGPWELRSMAAVHTFSSAMCWAACDRLAKIAGVLGLASREKAWRQDADRLHRVISERAWNKELNSFVSTFEGNAFDATLLLLHEINFLPPNDARIIATVEATGKALTRGNLMLRYAIPDDFGLPETAFLICYFWYIDALNAIGRRDEARALFAHALELRNPFGLLSEDVDTRTNTLWGNFPQAYSMVGLINTAMRLSKGWEDAF